MKYLIFDYFKHADFIGMVNVTFQGHLEVKIEIAYDNNLENYIFSTTTTINIFFL